MNQVNLIKKLNYGINLQKDFCFLIMYIFYICCYYFININYIKHFFAKLAV